MTRFALTLGAVALLAACASTPPSAPTGPVFSQTGLPRAVQVPAGNAVALETVGVGAITYQCGPNKDIQGQFIWVFVGPVADLKDRSGRPIGKYFGPPATFVANDGSMLTAAQVAVAPATAGNIPLQLLKANPATGSGAMTGTTYVQRVATLGGVPPATVCNAAMTGKKEVVKYQSDYIFWKAA
ncbi:MAG: DUF3455 domain-containing protein [Burkholderiaceae bacterium]